MGGVLLLIIARMLLGLIDSIQQEHRRRKQKRKSKQQKKRITQSGLCSTMCRDIANDAVNTTQALIQSQQPEATAGGNEMKVIRIDDSNRREYGVSDTTIEQAAAKYGHTDDQVQLWIGDTLIAYAVWKQGSNHYSYCKHPYMTTGPIAGPCEWDILHK